MVVTANLGTTAKACNQSDCPGLLAGDNGDIFVHWQDDIYLLFDDGRATLDGFSAEYDFYDVYLYRDGELVNANTFEEYTGAYSIAIWHFNGSIFADGGYVCHLETDYAINYIGKNIRLAWNKKFDVNYFLSWVAKYVGEYQSPSNSPIVLQYENDGQWIDIPEAEYLHNTAFYEYFKSPARAKNFVETVPYLLSNGQYSPYGAVMTEKMTNGFSFWNISASLPAVDTGRPNTDAEGSFNDSADKLDGAQSEIADKMPDVSQDAIEGLYPDLSKLDTNVLANVHVLTNGIYSNVNIVALLSTGVGLAIIGYLLFGKKE